MGKRNVDNVETRNLVKNNELWKENKKVKKTGNIRDSRRNEEEWRNYRKISNSKQEMKK